MPNQVLGGRYEVEREIGRGGMGVVYRAHDVRLGRTVALKMLPPELLKDPDRRRRLAHEARAAATLSHAHLATVFDFEESGEDAYIVYEFVEGKTLREALQPGPWTTDSVLRIGIQLSEGLAAAHEHGIVHRDLKPENVMVRADAGGINQAKILDFGLAKFRKPLKASPSAGTRADTATLSTADGLLIGTVNYMAPEQLEGEPADARTDIYALGLTLYEMAAGANPFLGKTATSTIANILKQEAPPLRSRQSVIPAELDRILRKCLRKRREERYQSASELEVDLANLRRDLSARESGAAGVAAGISAGAPGIVARGTARILFAAIQAGYLVMYGVALYKWDTVLNLGKQLVAGRPGEAMALLILLAALVGTPARLYLFSALAVDYADTGLKFRRLFPWTLFLDLLWAMSALLLFPSFKGLTLAFAAALAYLPFVGRRLLSEVYSPAGGRASGTSAVPT